MSRVTRVYTWFTPDLHLGVDGRQTRHEVRTEIPSMLLSLGLQRDRVGDIVPAAFHIPRTNLNRVAVQKPEVARQPQAKRKNTKTRFRMARNSPPGPRKRPFQPEFTRA